MFAVSTAVVFLNMMNPCPRPYGIRPEHDATYKIEPLGVSSNEGCLALVLHIDCGLVIIETCSLSLYIS